MPRINILLYFTMLILFFSMACNDQRERKIKIAGERTLKSQKVKTASSILRVSPEEQSTIVILYFKNETGDSRLDWLRRGLTDMLVSDLAQSPYLNVITSKQLSDVSQDQNPESPNGANALSELKALSQNFHVDIVLTGRFYYQGDELHVNAELRDVYTQELIREENVAGAGLERIFLMVDQLSQRIRANLRGDLEASRERGLRLHEITSSLEAFRYYSQALEYIEKFLYVKADSSLERALKIDSSFAAAYLRLCEVKFRIGDTKAARVALKLAQRYQDKLSEYDRLWQRLVKAELAGDIEEILDSLNEILQFEPYDVETRTQLANILLRLGKHERAREEYELILELDPNRKIVFNQLAYLYSYLGDLHTALKYLDKYARLAPDEPNPYDSKGEILMRAGRLKEAVAQFETALSKQPSFYISSGHLASLYCELGNFDKAMAYCDRVIAQAPTPMIKSHAYVQRATILWRFGRIQAAKAALRSAQQAWRSSVEAVVVGAEMYRAIGDTAQAQALFRTFYDRSLESIKKNESDAYDMQNIIWFCMEADMPPDDLLTLMRLVI